MDDIPEDFDAFLTVCARVGTMLPRNWSETDTRVRLIDPVLAILGYGGIDDLRREVPVLATKEFLDYGLYDDAGRALAVVEAKALRQPLTDQATGQCVQYAVILGVRWCIITNGAIWAVYDARAGGALPSKHVATVRLDDGAASARRAWDVLSCFSKRALSSATPVTQLIVERVVLDELARPESTAVAGLRKVVRDRFGEHVSPQAVIEVISNLLAVKRAEPDPPAAPTLVSVAQLSQLKAMHPDDAERVTVAELVERGLLPPEGTLTGTRRGVTHTAQFRAGALEVKGERFASVSAAARAAVGGGSINGWLFWNFEGTSLDALRRQLEARTGIEGGV